MDPIQIIASALGGATVTAVVGLITFAITGSRDHRRWLYDLKYQNYLEVLRSWHRWERMLDGGVSKDTFAESEQIFHKISEVSSTELVLTASAKVDAAYAALLDAMHKQRMDKEGATPTGTMREWLALIHVMRRDLKIRGQVRAGA